jgi:P4 family phage/plasmid primase-like protien
MEPSPENNEPLDEGAIARTAFSLYLQDTERQVILHVIDHVKNNNIEVVSLIHDEILINSKSTLDLEEAHIYIKDQTINEVNFDVKFESKITSPTKEDWEWLEKHEPFIRKEDVNEIEKLRNAVMMLNKERVDDYNKCMKVIFAIGGVTNYSPEGRQIAHEFSKQSDKYDNAWVDKLYKPSKSGSSLKMGSIMKWIQEDEPKKKIEFQNDEEEDKKINNNKIEIMKKEDDQETIDLTKNSTDYDIARTLYNMFKDKYTAVSLNEKWFWYMFDGVIWRESPAGCDLRNNINTDLYFHILDLIKEYCDKAREAEEDEVKAFYASKIGTLNKLSHKIRQNSCKDAILKECAWFFKNADFFDRLDSQRNLIGFDNGVYDLEKGEFRKSTSNDMISLTTKYDYTDIINLDIRNEILEFFTSITSSIEMRDYLLTISAYMLTGDKRLEEFWILTGTGGNGKGVYAELQNKTYGNLYYSPDITILTGKKNDSGKVSPEIAKTKGKRFLMTSEPERDDKLQTGRLKLYTGGDSIQARGLYKEPTEFKPQFGIMLQTNGIPELNNFDGGIARRMRIVNLPFKFVENPHMAHEKQLDTTLKHKFESNVEYAQQFMILLLEYYNKNVKNVNKLYTPDEVMVKTNEYLKTQDAVGQFIVETYEITNSEKDKVKSADLYQEFKHSEFCGDISISNVKFTEQMLSKGLTKKRLNDGLYWIKIKKKVVDDNDDEL